ncbi:MAG: hypothetical protein OEX14_09015, partial [Paracoccaceae bacterium]|nr:hypothetical protein [Paracoccaceae bacterium]
AVRAPFLVNARGQPKMGKKTVKNLLTGGDKIRQFVWADGRATRFSGQHDGEQEISGLIAS